jgi:uncharacterized protein YjdB
MTIVRKPRTINYSATHTSKITIILVLFFATLFFSVPTFAQTITARAQVQNIGWQAPITASGNQDFVIGTTGQALRLEGVTFSVAGDIPGGVSYQTNVQDIGQQPVVSNGEVAGTVGQSRYMKMFRIYLTGELANQYDIWYRAFVQNYGWLNMTKNGTWVGAIGEGLRIEAIDINMAKKGSIYLLNPNKNFLIRSVISTTVYNTGSNPYNYKFFAINQNGRGAGDGIYTAPYGSTMDITENTNAMNNNKTIVYSDKAVMLADGINYTHINLNGTWCWIKSDALSWEKTENNGAGNSPISPHNFYNSSGEIRYINDSAFKDEFLQAVQTWNQALGGDVILPADATHPATLSISDVSTGSLAATISYSKFNGNLIAYHGKIVLNVPETQRLGLDSGGIKSIFVHELGHCLGIGHTYDGRNPSWGWSDSADVMSTGGNASGTQALTPQDISAAKLVRSLRMYANTWSVN